MTHWGSGVPEVAQSAAADGMDPERTVNTEGHLVEGSGCRNLKRTSPLTPIRRLETVLLKESGGIDRHELVPMVL